MKRQLNPALVTYVNATQFTFINSHPTDMKQGICLLKISLQHGFHRGVQTFRCRLLYFDRYVLSEMGSINGYASTFQKLKELSLMKPSSVEYSKENESENFRD